MTLSEITAAITGKFPEAKDEPGTGTVIIPQGLLLKVAGYIRQGDLSFDNLHCITAVDRRDKIELIYTLYSLSKHHAVTLKVRLPLENPSIESLTPIWKSANWLERETYDLMGVKFLNHPDLRRILNPYDWTGYPLRKDYSNPNIAAKPLY